MAAPCGICGATRSTKRIGVFWFCRDHQVDYSASPDALAAQLENAHREIAEQRAEIRTYASIPSIGANAKALHESGRRSESDWALLTRLASALLLAGVVQDAHSSSALHDGPATMSLRENSRPAPGSSTHPARKRANELRGEIRAALDRWDQAVDLRFGRPPKPGDEIPTVRCRVSQCPARDVSVKAWRRIRGGRTIYAERCSSCGTPYPPIEQEEAS